MDRVVEHAEEEDEVEPVELEQLSRLSKVTVDESMRRRELVYPLLVKMRVGFEVAEYQLRGLELAIDPARVDAVLRADFEHARTAEARDVEHLGERFREE